MPTLNIEGRRVTVDDGFLKLSPADQQATVDQIASSFAPEPVSTNSVVRSLATGVPILGGLVNKADAATNATLAPIAEPFLTPSEVDISRNGESWGERYAKSLAMQEGMDAKFQQQHPVVDTAAKLTGAVAGTIPLAAAAPWAMGAEGTLGGMMLRGGLANAALGGTDAAVRGESPLPSAALGGAVGVAGPVVGAIARQVAAPVVSNIRALADPAGYANRQVARAVSESGLSTQEIADRILQANAEGQGVFTLADAMDNAGQRLLSTVARGPGEGRTKAVQALESRQGDQGRRLSTALQEAFDAPKTAEQTRAEMVANANFEAGRNYAPVKRETIPIDVSAPVAIANRAISPAADNLARSLGALPTDIGARAGIEAQEAVLRDPIGNMLKEARAYLAAPTLTRSNVNQAFRAKTNIDMMIAKATDNNQGAAVAELIPVKEALDEALARTSSSYASARDAYKVAQRRIEALDLGKLIGSKPGRPEDAIRQFNALPEAEAQAAFRKGYIDPQISGVQNAAFGTNKARALTSDAMRQELDAFAVPGRAAKLRRQTGREQTMFQTRNAALGNSKTAENLADDSALSIDPSVIGHIFSGNYTGAARQLVQSGSNLLNGNTAEVRSRLADILLQRGADVTPAAIDRMLGETMRQIKRFERLMGVGREAVQAAAASAPAALSDKKQRRLYVSPAKKD